jgi:hypothetical protein
MGYLDNSRPDCFAEIVVDRKRRAGVGLVVLGLAVLMLPASAQAQSCNPEGTACIDTAGPLMPAQTIQFRVEAGATRVAAHFAQGGTPLRSAVKLIEVVASGPPGGFDSHQGVLPGETDRACFLEGGCSEPEAFGDTPTRIDVRFESPSTGAYGTFHRADYDTVAPTVNLSAHVHTPAPREVVGQFAFEARREVRATVELVLSGKREHSKKGWRPFDRESIDEVVGPGPREMRTPPLRRRCPRRFDKCRADVEAEVLTEAAGYWWGSGETGARLRRIR